MFLFFRFSDLPKPPTCAERIEIMILLGSAPGEARGRDTEECNKNENWRIKSMESYMNSKQLIFLFDFWGILGRFSVFCEGEEMRSRGFWFFFSFRKLESSVAVTQTSSQKSNGLSCGLSTVLARIRAKTVAIERPKLLQ
jgi:hypothetical protein